MKRYLIVLMSTLLAAILLIGCNNSKGAEAADVAGSISMPLENANESNSTALCDNTLGLERKEKFLNSKEGHDFQVISWKFTKAYLSGDVGTMERYLIDPENKDYSDNTENMFEDVEFLILKLDPKNIKEDTVIAEYEFGLKGQDSLTYLNLEMKIVDNEWKVQFCGLEK